MGIFFFCFGLVWWLGLRREDERDKDIDSILIIYNVYKCSYKSLKCIVEVSCGIKKKKRGLNNLVDCKGYGIGIYVFNFNFVVILKRE